MVSAQPASQATLDARALRIVNELAALPQPDYGDAEAVRRHHAQVNRPLLWSNLPVGSIEHFRSHSRVPPLTIFRPVAEKTGQQARTFLFFHGGGWALGDFATYEPLCRRLCNALKANIVYVDYRLAPEHAFPAALFDSESAARWLFANAFRLGVSPARIGVIGDGAGGNLAAVLALRNRRGALGGSFQSQVLIYPHLDLSRVSSSERQRMVGDVLPNSLHAWYAENYLQGHSARDWRVSPLLSRNLDGVAPAVMVHAGFDPLLEEARLYVQRLRDVKVPVKEISFPDMMHGFINMGAVLDQAELAVLCIRAALHTLLANRLPVR